MNQHVSAFRPRLPAPARPAGDSRLSPRIARDTILRAIAVECRGILVTNPTDPIPPRWAEVELPDAWADRESGARGAWRLVRHALRRRRARVELPQELRLA